MTLKKPARSAIAEILNKRSDKTHPRNLYNLYHGMLHAANNVQLPAGDKTTTLSGLIDDYRVHMTTSGGLTPRYYELDRHRDVLLQVRDHLLDSVIMDTNPLIDGTTRINSYKDQLKDSLKRHPANFGTDDKAKEDVARDWTDRIVIAMVDTLTPELQAGLSSNSGRKR